MQTTNAHGTHALSLHLAERLAVLARLRVALAQHLRHPRHRGRQQLLARRRAARLRVLQPCSTSGTGVEAPLEDLGVGVVFAQRLRCSLHGLLVQRLGLLHLSHLL